jgi:tetratricopeptide (TPR) repeat protein
VAVARNSSNGAVHVSSDALAGITALVERGLYLQAYDAAREVGPFEHWTGSAASVLAARLVGHLGASRASRGLILKAYRRDRTHPAVLFFYASALLRRRGPLFAWRFFEHLEVEPDGAVSDRAELLGLRARVASSFRDFDTADRFLSEGFELDPANAWLQLERSYTLEERDDYEGALAVSGAVLANRAWYRPALQAVAHQLQLLNRDGEALELLRAGMEHLESEAVAAQLAVIETELGQFDRAHETLQRYKALAPLLEGSEEDWWHGQMSDVEYQLGNLSAAAEHARLVKGRFFEHIAARLNEPKPDGRRVHLPVGFVRQHRSTCAPATLAAISQFWELAVDHLALAAAICYDGTPDHVERHWAIENGWIVAEFTMTWETTVALLDRGIPFTVTTVEPDSAHLQAAIGYDDRRGTLLVRDPFDRMHREFLAEAFFERYAAHGPRGMVFVPKGRADLLEGLPLPDADRYDRYYALRRALAEHDRETAQACCAQLQELDASHRLAIQARRALALYDANEAELLAATEALLQQHPEDGQLSLSKLASLRSLGRRRDTLSLLQDKTNAKDPDAAFLREYAREIFDDASQRDVARRLMMRATRLRPADADNLHVLAGLHWEERNFTAAAKLYRLAACLADKTEYFFRSFFQASRNVGKPEEAIDWLRRRFEQHGDKSSLPARTLFTSLSTLNREDEAFEVLERALLLRAEDGELLTFAAEEFARVGRVQRAAEFLERANGRAARGPWLRTRAVLVENQSELAEALRIWREVLLLEPLAMDANRAVARLMAEVEGRDATLRHLQEICARFSHHVPLHKLWLDWTREWDQRENILRTLLELGPEDAWSHREMALLLADQTRFEEAKTEVAAAFAIEPLAPSSHAVAGRVLVLEGRSVEAQAAYREALKLSVDADSAIDGLLGACSSFEEKRESLEFVRGELKRQVSFGDGLLAYRDAAYPVLAPAELLANLREAHAARPDLWHAWSALVAQLRAMEELDEALQVAREATGRFPLLPRIWYDLALVHKARREPADERAPLERALEISPAWGVASRELAAVHERLGDLAAAEAVLEKAIAATPSDAFNRGCLGDLYRSGNERERAIAEVQRALVLNPDYNWAWEALRSWSLDGDGENLAAQAARELVDKRAGESRSWLRLAEMLGGRENFAERLAAVDRALALNPRNVDAWDVRATILTEEGRYEDALESCRPSAFPDVPPVFLRGRAAWIEAQRGRTKEAIKQMRALVDEAPDYFWGWGRLSDWHIQRKEPALALEAAEQMSRLEPQNVAVLGYVGDALLELDRRDEAKEAFTRAWDLDPLYAFGANKLFDLQLADKQWTEAEATLEKMKRHIGDADVLSNEVRLAAARGDKQRTFDTLGALCERKGAIGYALDRAGTAVRDAGWGADAEALFAQRISSESANGEVGWAWIKELTYRSGWHWWIAVHRLVVRTEAQKEALRSAINAIGEQKRVWLLRYLLWRFGNAVVADDAAWANASYALAHCQQFRRTIAWMEDWPTRSGIKPWMLLNLANALQECRRDEEARAVRTAALELPADHTTHFHYILAALDEALAGQFDEARHYRALAGDGIEQADAKPAVAPLNALLDVHEMRPEQRRAALPDLRTRLLQEMTADGPLDAGSRRLYRRTLLRMAEIAGDRAAKISAYLRTLPRPNFSPTTWHVLRVSFVLLLIFRAAWWPQLAAAFNYLRRLLGL